MQNQPKGCVEREAFVVMQQSSLLLPRETGGRKQLLPYHPCCCPVCSTSWCCHCHDCTDDDDDVALFGYAVLVFVLDGHVAVGCRSWSGRWVGGIRNNNNNPEWAGWKQNALSMGVAVLGAACECCRWYRQFNLVRPRCRDFFRSLPFLFISLLNGGSFCSLFVVGKI